MTSEDKKAVLVTGAAGGLGSALAMAAAGDGWQVVMIDKNRRGLERCYDRIVGAGGLEPFLQIVDLAAVGPEECEKLNEALLAQFGGLDALVHCAVSFQGLQPLDLIEPQSWLQQVQVNLNAPWLLTSSLLPLLKRRSTSSLIFLMDELAESRALWGAYATSKSAIRSLAAQFNAELRSTTVSVYAVDPGPMRTSLRSSVYHSENPMEVVAAEVRAEQLLGILNHKSSARDFYMRLGTAGN